MAQATGRERAALCLLCVKVAASGRHVAYSQVGEFDIVLEVGGKVLEKWEARSMRRDILFAMALAHCGLATKSLDGKDKVRACAVPQH